MKALARGIALSLVAVLAACGGGTSGPPAEPADTVVLVYLIGSSLESDPEANATVNLREMMGAGPLSNTTVVVATGGSDKTGAPPPDPRAMQPENIDWKRLQRYVVHPTSLEQVMDLGAEDRLDPNRNMASAVAFLDFLDWAVEAHPARRYLVVLWDHGGGINNGIGRDSNTDWKLSVADIGIALRTVVVGRGASIEMTGFDACLMANAEVASALYRSSRYMVASQDTEPGTGWDYQSFLRYVDGNPTASGAAIGAEIVRGYVAKQLAGGQGDVTLSVVDVEGAAAVGAALDAFASSLGPYAVTQAGWNQVAKARVRTLDWYTTPLDSESLDLADLRGLVTNVLTRIVSNLGPDPALESDGEALIAAIDASVKTNAALGTNAKATGLSVYFPSVLAGYPAKGYAVNTSMGTTPFFAGRYTSPNHGLVQAYFEFYLRNAPALQATVSMTHDPTAPLSAIVQNDFDGALAAHREALCPLRVDGLIVPGPCFDSFRAPDEVTNVRGGNSWWLNVEPSSPWPVLSGAAGVAYPVALLPDTVNGKTAGSLNDHVVPASQWRTVDGQRKPVRGQLLVREVLPADGGAPTYEVAGFRDGEGEPGRTRPLVDGQVYVLLAYATVGRSTGWFVTDREVTVSGGTLSLAFAPLGPGQLGYFVTDLTGATQESGLVPYPPAP